MTVARQTTEEGGGLVTWPRWAEPIVLNNPGLCHLKDWHDHQRGRAADAYQKTEALSG